jgi:parallel beta-helix repeat protein
MCVRPAGRSVATMRTLTALGVALVVAALPSNALAAGPSCGDTIMQDTTLHRDLTNCPGDGLVIGADGVTLDLNGHTIDGDGAGEDDLGVADRDAHSRLTVVDGTIREFGIGIYAEGGADHRLRDVNAVRNTDFGAILQDATRARVTRSTFHDNGVCALVLGGADHALVARNTATGSGGYAFVFFDTNDSTIRENGFDGNEHGMLLDGSSRNVVEHNTLTHSAGSSIDLGNHPEGNRVEWNRLADNGDGIIVVDGQGTLVRHNLVTGTGFFGDPETAGLGLFIDGGDSNAVDANVVNGGRGPALFVAQWEAPSAPSHTTLTGNVANSRADDGIRVESGAVETLVARNLADRNGDDGIDVAAGTTVARNSADHNHDLGIEAAPGVTDGGGNRAHGNGDPRQCTTVACR